MGFVERVCGAFTRRSRTRRRRRRGRGVVPAHKNYQVCRRRAATNGATLRREYSRYRCPENVRARTIERF